MLAAAVALTPDVAIVEGNARVRAGRTARFHITLLHTGTASPGNAIVNFGDGQIRYFHYTAGLGPHVFDALAAHMYARAGTYAVTVRVSSGRVLATEQILVDAAPATPPPAVDAGAQSPLIVAPPGAAAPLDPTHSGILIAPGLPAVPATEPPPAAAPIAPNVVPVATLTPRPVVPPGAPIVAPTPTPTETPRLTTGDR